MLNPMCYSKQGKYRSGEAETSVPTAILDCCRAENLPRAQLESTSDDQKRGYLPAPDI